MIRSIDIINGELFIGMSALKNVGISVGYYMKEKSIGNNRLIFINHPNDNRLIYVSFETMSNKHKDIIRTFYGNPYECVARQPVRDLIIKNEDVLQSLLRYRYGGDNMALPVKRVKQYSRAADIISALIKIDDLRNKPIKEMNLTIPEFYNHLIAIIKEEQVNGSCNKYDGYYQLYDRFPARYDSLRCKVAEYKKQGYHCLISKQYGNEAALKIKEDDSKDLLIELLKNPLQYDDVLIAMLYNTEAQKNGWKAITDQTVGNWRSKFGFEISLTRNGNNIFNERYIREVKGLKPSTPLRLVEHDDNNLDFLYQDEKKYQYHRYVAIVVSDSYCNLVLGKSIIQADTPQTWQVQHAYIDAMYYIRSLAGGWFMPFEIKADKWASADLQPLYQRIAKYVPPSHGNKHRGYIEQLFGSPIWKRAQKLVSQGNWSGNNISSKNRGFNPDMLTLSAKDKSRPMIGEDAELQIEQFFYLLRHMPDFKRTEMNAKSKEQKWLEAWSKMSDEDKRPITDEQFLLTFGITHSPKHQDTIRITNRGIEPQINKVKYSYDLPEAWMYNKLCGAAVQVIYDPYDMSRVLITDNKGIRFIAKNAQLAPRALKDHYTGSRTFLNSILEDKKKQVKEVVRLDAKRKKVNTNHAMALLQAGQVLPKEIKNAAEQKQIEQFNQQYEEHLDSNIDFNEYL
ncbi:MAG: hypothetical protein IT249_19955 [Chitinophagaceae bacterium]|nr:hypothetical protein [Chitinophagaceae bacterium]